jgi:hypothetical protein
MEINKMFNQPYSINSGGSKVTGSTVGGGGGGSTDSVVLSKAEDDYGKTLLELRSKANKLESSIEMNKMELNEPLFDLKPQEKENLEKTIAKLEKDKVKADAELADAKKTNTEDFGKTKVEGSWSDKGKEYSLKFTDGDNTPNMAIELDMFNSSHKAYIKLDNKGISGKDGDNVEILLPLTEKEVKNYDAIEGILASMPSKVKSVEVEKTDGFFSGERTSVTIHGDDGKDLSFKIVNGKFKTQE